MNQLLTNIDKWIIYKCITFLVSVYLLNTKKEWAKQSRTTNITVLEFTEGWENMLQRNSSFLTVVCILILRILSRLFWTKDFCSSKDISFRLMNSLVPIHLFFRRSLWLTVERSCYSNVLCWGIRWM